MSAQFPKPEKAPKSRNSLRWISDAEQDALIFGTVTPPVTLLFRAFYGPDYARIMSRRYGWRPLDIYQVGSGKRALPRTFLQDMIDDWENPVRRAAWERAERAKLEAQLKRRLERRVTVLRWCRLLLGGMALPVGVFRAWRSGRVENFKGKNVLSA